MKQPPPGKLVRAAVLAGGTSFLPLCAALSQAPVNIADSALADSRAAHPITREVGNRRVEAITLSSIGGLYSDAGLPDSALAYFRLTLPITGEVGNRRGEAATLNRIGAVCSDCARPPVVHLCPGPWRSRRPRNSLSPALGGVFGSRERTKQRPGRLNRGVSVPTQLTGL